MKLNNIYEIKYDIQSIEFANYVLAPLNNLNSKSKSLNVKEGFLLKINFNHFGVGYADCFSWEELGDLSLNQQIKYLKNGIYNTHLEKCVYFANLDAQYRAKKQNIFKNLCLPKNHFTCANYTEISSEFIENLRCKGFSIIKLKCGISIKDEINLIKNIAPYLKKLKMSVRLDFNSILDLKEFCHFLSLIEDCLDVISFIEDPIIYSENTWNKIKYLFPAVRLALDRIQGNFFTDSKIDRINSCDYLVLKPAIQNINKIFEDYLFLKKQPFLFTSYMDHPLGQLSALYEASLFYCDALQDMQDCGFLTHTLYDKNSYSETLSIVETKLVPSLEGTGFGFDALLEKECWRKLK